MQDWFIGRLSFPAIFGGENFKIMFLIDELLPLFLSI